MQNTNKDIIVAQATPPGKGGVGVIRVSGENLDSISKAVLHKITAPRVAEYLPFFDSNNEPIDIGLAIYFPAPNSFTGEDVLELHGHGGQIIMDLLIERVLSLGARLAEPGEFSLRAFLNDKMDLTQAEAISDLINATTEASARSSIRSLRGEFSNRVHVLVDELIHLRMYVESAIDFPEEEIDFLADDALMTRLKTVLANIEDVFESAKQGCVLSEGMTVVIVGQPNAGKSSLLNRLTGYDAAIVTEIAGTTRDVLRERININGMPLHIIDTAGLRENADIVEKEGIKRAWKEVESADHILLVLDDTKGFEENDAAILEKLPSNLPLTIVHNKIDLNQKEPAIEHTEASSKVYLSAEQNNGIELLRKHLTESMGYKGETQNSFTARRRHLHAIERARDLVKTGFEQISVHKAGELLAEDLRHAQSALNEITGEFDSDDLLGEIFSSFCIGK